MTNEAQGRWVLGENASHVARRQREVWTRVVNVLMHDDLRVLRADPRMTLRIEAVWQMDPAPPIEESPVRRDREKRPHQDPQGNGEKVCHHEARGRRQRMPSPPRKSEDGPASDVHALAEEADAANAEELDGEQHDGCERGQCAQRREPSRAPPAEK